jgi:hypothetical protein
MDFADERARVYRGQIERLFPKTSFKVTAMVWGEVSQYGKRNRVTAIGTPKIVIPENLLFLNQGQITRF